MSEINPGSGTGLEIAVIGMAGRFPGAKNIHEFWENLKNGIESITFFSDEEVEALGTAQELYRDPNYVKAVSILDDVKYFDGLFFGYAPIDAELMAPQIRLFHECTWHALEDAGYVSYTYNGSIGVYAGSSPSSHWEAVSFFSGKHAAAGEFGASLLADKDHLSTRISYNFNFKGPSFTVSTACSTSLVAIHLACQGLLSGECKMAAAGGVTVITPRGCGYLHQEEGTVLSPDGHCRSFDARSGGTILGEGVGVVILKSLEDALGDGDHIYAIIKGSAVNNDGSGKVGYTAPGVKGQAAVIRAALHAAEVEPETISYIEAHGTGTEMGDPIEINALKLAFNTDKKGFCRIGSVKSNVGHLVYAAGVTGFIKLALALHYRLIPPSLFFETPNPGIDFQNSSFVVNTRLTPWKTDGYPLRAGLSSFGLGGTNAHVILEEAPEGTGGLAPLSTAAVQDADCMARSADRRSEGTRGLAPLSGEHPTRDYQLIILSAKTPTALDRMTENLAEYLKNNLLNPGNHDNPTNPGPVMADAAYTLQVGRMAFPYRRTVVCSEVNEAIAALSAHPEKTLSGHLKEEKRPVIFMFSGLGSQYVNMGLGLYQGEEVFRRELDRCGGILETLLGCNIIEILYPTGNLEEAERKLDNMIYSGPIKFMFEYSLAKLLISWGIRPEAMIGHSFGEYAAACLSGVFSLEDALKLVVLRGQLLAKAPEGAMLSVPLSEDQVNSLLELKENKDLSLAAVNAPSLCIVSGPGAAVDRLEKELKEQNGEPVRINVTRAGHSKMMAPIAEEFREGLNQVTWHKPGTPYVSGLTGTWIKEEQARDPGYWTSHLQETIKFSRGLQELLKKPAAIFVEISPGRGLTLFLNQQPSRKASHQAIHMVRHRKENTPDVYYTLGRLGEMWLYGAQVDWQGFYANQKRHRIPLPVYPFQHQRYWLEGDISSMIKEGIPGQFLNKKRPNMADWFYTPSWKRSVIPAISPIQGKWLVFPGHGGFVTRLLNQLIGHESENDVVIVKKGNEFKKEENGLYTINPAREKDYEALIRDLRAPGDTGIPTRIIHAWNLIEEDNQGREHRRLEYQSVRSSLDLGFYSLLYLVRALAWQDFKGKIEITVLTDNMQEVLAEKVLHPEQAVVLGPVMVIPREFPAIKCRCIDINLAELGEAQEEEERHWLIDSLLKEFKSGIIDTLIAYRGQYRLTRTFEPVPLNQPASLTPRLRKKGVYLITGGLGGIGLVMARHLAETLRAKLILLGRSSFPAGADWEKWLNTHDHSDSISRKIREVKELESLGAEVMIFSVNVVDEPAMSAMVEKVLERFGTINGVIHAAGIPGGGLIQLKTREMADRVLDPKVKGTLVLDHVLQGTKPDFIMLCSSVSSVVPFLGQVDYFAANAFLDSFAYYKTSVDKIYTVSINWDSWQEVGGAVEAAKQMVLQNPVLAETGYEDFLKEAILPGEGVEAFMRILDQTLPQVVVSAIDLPSRFAVSETLHASMADLGKEEETIGSNHPRPVISSSYIAPITPAQQKLALVWQNILAIDRVGIDDDFFELGGDSLKATVVISKIKKEFNTDISLKEIFITPRIRDLAKPLETPGSTREPYTAVEPVEKKEYYPLTPMQKRLYILDQIEGIGTAYNQPYAWIVKRNIDRRRLEQTFRLLLHRHEILRTSFHMVNEKPIQKVHDQVNFEIEYDQVESAATLISSFIRPFDLSSAPLLKVGLVKLPGENHLLVFDIHHIAADGTSFIILLQDFITLYENQGKDFPGLRVRYKDFSVWLNSDAWKAINKKQEESWLKEFQGEIPKLDIFTDYPRPALQNFEGDGAAFELESHLTKALKELVLSEGATLFMVVLALYTILLSRLSGQEDIIVGTPVAARRHPDLEHIMGMFVNTLAIRNQPTGTKSFKAFLAEVKKRTLEAFENQEYPFEKLVDKVRVQRDTSRNPLFDVMVTLDNYMPVKENPEGWQPGENLFKNKISRFDITFDVYDRGENLVFTVDYCVKLFKKQTIERLIGYFRTLVSSVLKDRDKAISEIEILPDREKEKILNDFNNTAADYPTTKTIHRLFAEQAELSPGYIALVGPQVQYRTHMTYISYRELNERSNQLAALLKEKGVQPDTIVGIMLEQSIEMIIGIFGILKAGGAYLPIDPGSPQERIDFMLKDSSVEILLTGQEIVGLYSPQAFNNRPKGANSINNYQLTINNLQLEQASLAYIIYTSGTTGQPKAVTVEHRNAVNTLLYRKEEYKMNPGNRALQLFSYAFDGFVTSFFTPIISGAAVVLLHREEIKEIAKIKAAVVRHKVTHFISVPGLFHAIIDNMSQEELCSLKVVTLAGDRLLPELPQLTKKKNKNMELAHEYGVTEAAVMNTIFRHQQKNPRILIGKPIANTEIYIVNQANHPQPIGVPGELCIAGTGVARGYLNQPELTTKKFWLRRPGGTLFEKTVPPGPPCKNFSLRVPGNVFYRSYQSYTSYIIYKTGDLARWLPEGNIEFLGRIDHQLKIRGFRIEPGEIEDRLSKHKSIKQALVIALPDDDGSKYLCAYIAVDFPLETSELRKYLSAGLPGYMIPSVFVQLEKIPLTPNGKVDRKALPEPGIDTKGKYMAPRNPIEKKLLEIWSNVLNIDKNVVGIDADFFELGGHSLKATILISKIHKELNIKVPLEEVLKRRTIKELSAYLRQAVQSKYVGIEQVEKKEYYDLSSAQKRLYFLQQMDLTSTAYNIPLVFPLGENLQIDRVEASLKQLITRHESLRTSFIQVNETAVQRVFDPDEPEFAIEYYNLATGDKRQRTEGKSTTHLSSVIRHLSSEFIRPFDLSRAPLIRSAVIKQAEGNHIWLVDIHHIVSDGTSHIILAEDFMGFYNGNGPDSGPLQFQYKDFSRWQNRVFASGAIKIQEDYWLELYSDSSAVPRLNLIDDYKRPEVFTYTGDLFDFRLESKDAAAFNAFGTRNGATLYMNILAALNTLFYKYTSQTDIIIGTGIAGRHHADIQRIIGMFVNTLAIRSCPKGEKTYEAYLKEVITQSIQAFENQDVQFEELVDRLELERAPSRNPLFDIMMVVQNFKPFTHKLPGIENPDQIQTLPFTSKFDMTFFVYEETGTGEICIDIEYYTAIFKKETINHLVRHFKKLIKEVVSNPAVKLDDIDIVPEEEKQQLIYLFNDTTTPYPREKTIGELFERQVERTPHHTAIVQDQKSLAYKTFDEESNRLANYLCRENGVVPGEPVGIMMDRTISMMVAIIGILKAGGAYVPISPSFPEERIKTMIHDAGIKILISQKRYIKTLNRLQWECRSLDTFLCVDSENVHSEKEEKQSELMSRKLWEYVGETSVDEITGGGWNSSYTGDPIPKAEMDEYGDNILKKLQPLLHKHMRVLEIGAASGISMYRIAPKVGLYYGTDLSSATIEKNRKRVKQEKHKNIKLARLAAHEIDQLDNRDFDLVILNSVIQCFSGHNYLKKVIGKIINLMGNKGYIFIGDIMDQELKEDLIADLVKFKEAHPGKNDKTKTDWSEELFISRSFLQDLRFEFPRISAVEFSPKIYTIENELTKYRYDALIILNKPGTVNRDPDKSFCGGSRGAVFSKSAPLAAGGKHKHQHDLRILRTYGTEKPKVDFGSDNLAYIIYTSGSTGKPKGTLTTHYNVTRVVKNTNYIDLQAEDRVLQLSDYAFDGSVFDIYGALLNGAVLVMVKREDILEIETLCHLIKKEKISVFFVTTALFNTLVDVGLDSLSGVRKILFGGERVSTAHAGKALKYLGRDRILHVYGPTETTVYASYYPVNEIHDRQITIPIGSPISNTTFYILDPYLRFSAIGISGEIYIGGTGVALGYLNNPGLTCERFINYKLQNTNYNVQNYKTNKKVPGKKSYMCFEGTRGLAPLFLKAPGKNHMQSCNHAIMQPCSHVSMPSPHHPNPPILQSPIYRTGDLGRWLIDGNIEFIGRIDQQVKIRGFRIELGEIESSLLKHGLIKEAVVMDREEGNSQRYLCAYIVPERTVDTNELREFLAHTLPDYMIPSYFVQLEEITLTSNGKVDRKALPEPGISVGKDYAAPRGEIEKKLAEIWSEVLCRDVSHASQLRTSLGIDDNFFELGGHSLKATTLTAKIHKQLGIKVPLAEIFKGPTIRELTAYIKGVSEYRDKYISIEPVEKKDYYILSSAQQRLYILQHMDTNNIGYNSSVVVLLEGQLDEIRVKEIFLRLITRHESLRTSFHLKDKVPVQVVHAEVKFEIEYDQVEEEQPSLLEGTRGLAPLFIKEFIRPFDLSRAPLLRVGLIGLENNQHILMVDMHHIITDGTSHGIFIKEFTHLYAGKELLSLKLQYKDYAWWQNSAGQGKALKVKEEYWLNQFAAQGDIPVLSLPYDYPRPLVQSFAGNTINFEIGKTDTEALNVLALKQETTLYMLLLSIFTVFLSKVSGQEDIIVGTPTAGRRHADLQEIIGMFVNTLALRNFPTGEKPFKKFLEEVKQRTLEAFENQEYQFEELVENVRIERDASRNPLFDTMFALQNLDRSTIEIPGLKLKPYDYKGRAAKFDLFLQCGEVKKGMWFNVEYCTALFREETIQRFIGYIKRITAAVLEDSQVKLSQIEILPEDEKKQVLFDFNDTQIEYPKDKTIHQLFEEQAKQTPDRTALITHGCMDAWMHEAVHVTYCELNVSSNQLAHLLREKGVQTDTIVGIMVEPSLPMIIGIIGILKAGGAYLPLDPDYPEERVQYMLSDSGARVLVRTVHLAKEVKKLRSLEDKGAHETIFIDSLDFSNLSSSHLLNFSTSSSLAYVIYTSGSTGNPKGVLVEHRSVVNLLLALQREYPLLESDAYLLKTSYLFDVSVTELFGWFLGGGRLKVMEPGSQKEPLEILDAVQRYHITHINFVPSMFVVLLEFFQRQENHGLGRLKYIFLAGEALQPELVHRFRSLQYDISLENLYGPTECTIYASRYSLSQWSGTGSVPIGTPLANLRLYILNQYHRLQPIGTAGELCISGIGLARGYLNRPELTAEKFDLRRPGRTLFEKNAPVKHPDTPRKNFLLRMPGSRFYRSYRSYMSYIYHTGDLARWLPDGNIEFLGRLDHQVKIRGFRIETGEIESRLLNHDKIKETVVVQRVLADGDRCLCAYIVGIGSIETPGIKELREYLSRMLPDYMIPSYFVPLARIPRTVSGKIDRKALPTPYPLDGVCEYTSPRNTLEKKLVEMWASVLGTKKESIGIDANFFHLGGHSLKATILAARLNKEYGVNVTLAEIFKSPTIRGLALKIQIADPVKFVDMEPVEKKEYYELSYNQKRLWIIYCMNSNSSSYHLPGLIHFDHAVNTGALENALFGIFARHESLRTGFKQVNDQPMQFILENVDVPFVALDISTLPENEKQQKTSEIIRQTFTQPFDLSTPPLFRSALIKQENEAFVFVYNMHHIVSDGWSMEVLKEDFNRLYDSYSKGKTPLLQPLQFQYKNFVQWHNRQIQSLECREKAHRYWKKAIESGFQKLKLPYYYNGSPENRAGAAFRCVVNRDIKHRLLDLAKDNSTTLFTVLFSIYNLLLAYLSGQEKIPVTIINAGREHPSLHMIVGYFINPVIVKTRVDLERDFKDLLSNVNKNVLEAFQHQNYPFELAADDLDIEYPNISTAFNLLNMQDISTGMELDSMESYHLAERQEAKFPLSLMLTEYRNGIEISWEYQKSLFKPETIETVAEKYVQLMDEITGRA